MFPHGKHTQRSAAETKLVPRNSYKASFNLTESFDSFYYGKFHGVDD
jgi:hypothetical protein